MRPASGAESPSLVLHCTALDDTHRDASLPLLPRRAATLVAAPATCAPSSVTLTAPVAGPFTPTAPLATTMAWEKAALSDPTTTAAEITVLSPEALPAAPLPTTALDDTHIVVAPPLWPMRAPTLEPEPSTLDPSTVTLAAPVVGPLLPATLVADTGPLL
jgi:hypothetical protein